MPKTFTGILHVHSDMSDGEGTLKEIINAAKDAAVDFVVLTDHGTRGYAQEDMEGWHDGVLIMCGEEVTTAEGHFLSFESEADVGKCETMQEGVDRARNAGGVTVSIHHQLNENASAPITHVLPLDEADLLEIWSFTDEILANLTPENAHRYLNSPTRCTKGPRRMLRRRWDTELKTRMLPIIGGVNAHQRKEPLFDWRLMFPYSTSFKSIATVVQLPDLPSHGRRACQLVWSALRNGRSYLANRDVASEKDFHFEYRPPNNGRPRFMGETAGYDKAGRFYIKTPTESEIVLRHNGQPLLWGTGTEITFPIAGVGSYRVELYLDRRLYIMSNPIRLVDDEGVVHPTVSDVT